MKEEIKKEKIPVIRQLILLGIILLLLFGGLVLPKIISIIKLSPSDSVAYIDSPKDTTETKTKDQRQAFDNIEIVGKSAYVWDIQSQQILYQKDPNTQLPIASVTKLMTALVAYEILNKNVPITISNTAVKQVGHSSLLEDDIFHRKELSDMLLISSSNDASYALAAAAGSLLEHDNASNAFVYAMNIRAKELSLQDTFFRNSTGLDISDTEGGAYGTAKDMSVLMEYILINHSDILHSTTKNKLSIHNNDGVRHDTFNTNHYIQKIPGLIGSKTGFTNLSGGNLVVAFDAGLNRPIVISVLGSTRHERFIDVLTLIKATKEHLSGTSSNKI